MTDIIIPFYNKAELTIQCLESVMAASRLHCRIILVDDGSDPAESEGVERFMRLSNWPHHLLRKNRNEGYKEAIRTGIRVCSGKFVILLNNDTIPTPGFDKKLVQVLLENPGIKASAPVSNHPTDLFQFRQSLYSIQLNLSSTPEKAAADFENACGQPPAQFTIAPYLTGMCLALDRQLFVQIGVFEDFYRNGYFEDLDLCCQIRNKGYELAVVEDCFVYHQGHATYRQKSREEKHDIILHNFKLFSDKWGHVSEHKELLIKMEFAGKEDPF